MAKNYSRPKLGQHFLVNQSAIKKIIAALNLKKGETIIEVGAGEGALTLPLARKCAQAGCRLIAIEKDLVLANELRRSAYATVNQFSNLKIIPGDALKLINSITDQLINWKLVGNIPYYLTGRLLRILSELPNKPKLIVFTLQREVAERITARAPKMNLLSAITRFWAEPKIIGNLKAEDFKPRPKVQSAILTLEPKKTTFPNLDAKTYYAAVKKIFRQPRKTLFNNLRAEDATGQKNAGKCLQLLDLTHKERPQDLNLEMLIKLAACLNSNVI